MSSLLATRPRRTLKLVGTSSPAASLVPIHLVVVLGEAMGLVMPSDVPSAWNVPLYTFYGQPGNVIGLPFLSGLVRGLSFEKLYVPTAVRSVLWQHTLYFDSATAAFASDIPGADGLFSRS